MLILSYIILLSLGGPTPYAPIDIYNDNDGSVTGGIGNAGGVAGAGVATGSGARRRNPGDPLLNADQMRRARVLCAYDAKDHTELNLNANEVCEILVIHIHMYICI